MTSDPDGKSLEASCGQQAARCVTYPWGSVFFNWIKLVSSQRKTLSSSIKNLQLTYWVGQKIHLGFSIKLLPENPNKHFGQPNIHWDRILLISIKDLESLKEQRGGPVRYFVLFKACKAWVSIISCCVRRRKHRDAFRNKQKTTLASQTTV